MSYYIALIISLFILAPAIIGAIRFLNINTIFYPFIISIWVNAINLILGFIIVEFGYFNTFHYNIWFLIDALIWLWLFRKWNLFESQIFYKSLWFLLIVAWLLETIFLSKLTLDYNSYFRILYSFIVILMSISTINSILMKERKLLLKNPMFVISCTLVLANIITVLTEAFFASNLQLGDEFRSNMERMVVITSLLCNLIYALAILWMPKKQAFILQY
jgi:hypothetical protein